mmetsp:Transcript_6925/g.8297  ORF Transcript_6925/g.8297 Transcript_6925/m.8297 type:complete len:95 (-) Transcript_6925:416-700(-)|eukprot:CAMPEP_0170456202 /NCGR_PEP_ID=MMETSP0123-20130129/3916_1 /TAXON_ID=182087 /ORGANISM="Favella ehrenbergii, Strain Fehren 1" /LENGTH=94 /DNA_ID=CAMNT_0010719603 /DNA_START=228 /DNA_END=512 /DNA_ORIENTATION=-
MKKTNEKPEEAKSLQVKAEASLAAKDNPWGLDESQYYIELGGVSKFNSYRKSLKRAPTGASLHGEDDFEDPFTSSKDNSASLISQIEKVLSLLD